MEEIWKKMDGYYNYEISNYGSVRNISGKIIKCQINDHGYNRIKLINDNNFRKSHAVHRLVAYLFIPNIDNKQQVNHINGIKTDNSYLNLEWCTGSENMKHASKNGYLYLNYGRSKAVDKYDLDFNFIETFESMSSASNSIGRGAKDIGLCCQNKKSCGGFKWRYSETIFDKKLNDVTPKPVAQKDLFDNIINNFISIGEASRITGINSKSIRLTCNGVQKTAGGYKWLWQNNNYQI